MPEKRRMTKKYAILCFRAGVLAAAIDGALGNGTIDKVRQQNWNLTEEYLEEMKQDAVKKGVDPKLLQKAERDAKRATSKQGFIDLTLRMQAISDRNN